MTPDGWSCALVGRWVQRWITFNVARSNVSQCNNHVSEQQRSSHVERRAEVSAIAESGTFLDIVAVKSTEAKVRLSAGRRVQVLEDLLVLRVVNGWDGGWSFLSQSVQLRVVQESICGIRARDRTVAIRLRRARIFRVDEPAVRAVFRGGRARARSSRRLGSGQGWVGSVPR